MSEESEPIAYAALRPGTPVETSDGHRFGSVEAVLVVEDLDVFDGIVVRTDGGTRFVDADYVGAIFSSRVVTTLSAQEAARLPLPHQHPSEGAQPSDGGSGSFFGRMFGRGKRNR